MINKLPSTFTFEKYELKVRLVTGEDSKFIVQLRTDPKLSRFIHSTDNNIEKQNNWIREYKKRESNGLDYYFIYYREDIPIGFNRLYCIDWSKRSYNGGSWLCVPGSTVNDVVATTLILHTIAFDILGLNYWNSYDGVHVDNKQVIKFNQMTGAKIYGTREGENGKYYKMSLYKDDFYIHRLKLEKLLGL